MHLQFNVAGTGRDLILLHGLFGSATNLGGLARRLATSHRVWTPDLRNHGSSPHSDQMNYQLMADDVLELMDHQSIAQAAVLGHSMGGKVAMVMALTAPERVAGLAVLDIAPAQYVHDYNSLITAMLGLDLSDFHSRAGVDRELAKSIPDQATRVFLLQNLQRTETAYRWRLNLPVLLDTANTIQGFPNSLLANRYDGPTVFIHGLESDYLTRHHRPAIHRMYPNADIVSLDQAGHWLHTEQPEKVLTCIITWLDGLAV